MEFKKFLKEKIKELKLISKKEKKLSGFMIGNTSKIEKSKFYFTPIRVTKEMVLSGLIVYSEKYAKIAAKYLDGKVDYVLVDAEKKIPAKKNGNPSNIERRVREIVKKTNMWVYKGNDLTVDAVDILLTNLLKNDLRGVGGKQILVIGAGNIGFKISLLMVERGAKVCLCARNLNKLKIKSKALNYIKPIHTIEKVVPLKLKDSLVNSSDIIIGATNGKPVVSRKMLENSKKNAIFIDLGKGTFYKNAIEHANNHKIKIYRADISAALEGQINKLLMMENIKFNKFERKKLLGETLVSSGLLGNYEEIIIDNTVSPKRILGMSDGKGDFIRQLSKIQKQKLLKIKNFFKQKNENRF